MRASLCLAIVLFISSDGTAQELPNLDDPELQIELFATEPLIQQPIGMAFDQKGRLFVIESHTHFRPRDWKGPEHDQIVSLTDSDGDGKADQREVIYGETDMTMDIATHPDGSLYVSTRDEVLRLRDADGDGKMEKVDRKIVWMESAGKYPHNGLSGLSFDSKGGVYLGMGENLGESYTLNGSDGTAIAGRGEGGNVWHFDANGKRLKKVATGFWNAFGVCVDPWGNVFATDNDPDSSPPCRLHHIVEGGDYGYQFRYGRSGTHPFVSWNGERLGTLPMLAGTGEAPCDVVFYAPEAQPDFAGLSNAWHGSLLVASWGDHRIESYQLTRKGASFAASRKILCQGGLDFRPVAFAVAPDGALFVSDWVRRSYELHGSGRIWKISAKTPRILTESPANSPALNSATEKADTVRTGPPPTLDEALAGLATDDAFLLTAWIERLSHEPVLMRDLANLPLSDVRQRAGVLLAGRRGLEREGITDGHLPVLYDSLLGRAVSDSDPRMALLALHWIADGRFRSQKFKLGHLLTESTTKPEIYHACLTAIARIDKENPTENDILDRVKEDIDSADVPNTRRMLALQVLPNREQNLKASQLESIFNSANATDAPWLVHLLGLLPDSEKQPILRRIAFDVRQSANARANALSYLEIRDEERTGLLHLAMGKDPVIQKAALQTLQGTLFNLEAQAELKSLAAPEQRALVSRILGTSSPNTKRPARLDDIRAWKAHLHKLTGEPDLDNGRRVFASPKLGACSACHRIEGIGSTAGPDLSLIGLSATPDYILESVLQPSRNVAPQWETFVITTSDGQTRTAFQMGERGSRQLYADVTGKAFEVPSETVVKKQRLPISIMPEGLLTKLTDEEIRDLIAFLSVKRE
jgi:putative membrane-bound dehydrogenase-like protein